MFSALRRLALLLSSHRLKMHRVFIASVGNSPKFLPICMHHGYRAQFDRIDRRDKGIFRLGRLWLLDILQRVFKSSLASATLTRCLPFRKTPSGWAFSLRF
jgi:hypothetical protein